MSDLSPEFAAEIIASCRSGAGDAAGSLASALGGEFVLSVGEAASYDPAATAGAFEGPGLAIALTFGDVGIAILLPESSGMLPEWCAEPDASGKSRLATLAQELSMLLVPESLAATSFEASHVAALATALQSAEVAADAQCVPISLKRDELAATLSLIWPLARPSELLLAETSAEDRPASGAESTVASDPMETAAQPSGADPPIPLPPFKRSLLKISVPVTVTLAMQRKPIQEIIELGPGSIVKFDKTCDEPLDLSVGDRLIARGDVVKVGDKFGLRISDMASTGEQFATVRQ